MKHSKKNKDLRVEIVGKRFENKSMRDICVIVEKVVATRENPNNRDIVVDTLCVSHINKSSIGKRVNYFLNEFYEMYVASDTYSEKLEQLYREFNK